MAEASGLIVLEKFVEYSLTPIVRQFKYIFCFNSIIKNLRDELEHLKIMRDGEQLRINVAKRNVQDINPAVETWLTNVEKIKTVCDRILEDALHVENRCLNGCCPNLKSRYMLSRKAMKMNREIVKLQGRGKFDWVSCPKATSMASASTEGFIGYESRISTMNEIMEALKEDEINMISICGMGGVGKTMMVKQVSETAKVNSLFEEVAMVVVSHNPDIFKIQGELAGWLGLKFDEGIGIGARAATLRTRLTDGQRVLVILDDVWESLDLVEVGLSLGGDCKGCKVVLTSRIERVCSEMGTQRNFTVEILNKQEAWDLFKEMAGDCVNNPDLYTVSKEVANECSGLPIAIVTVGKALRNRNKHAWDDALQQLRSSTAINIPGMHKKVYSSIELSYNYLESEQAKLLFLLCCGFPEDYKIPIEKLVRCGVGLQLFKDVTTLAATRNRVLSLIDELTSCYLLQLEEANHLVSMHDVVHDVGISIASKDDNVYIIRRNTGLEEWSRIGAQEPYAEISLMSQEALDLPTGQDFSNIKLLQLECTDENFGHKQTTRLRDFSREMNQLRVIGLEDMKLQSMPQGFFKFAKLRALSLDSCELSTEISFSESLVNLEILSFFNSVVYVWPSGIGQLSNLKLLDLRCVRDIPRIVYGVLSSLKKLEELYMGSYFIHNSDDEHNRGNCSITELYLLSCLNTLQIWIPPTPELLLKFKNFHFENMARFELSMVERTWPWATFPLQLSNSVSLYKVDAFVVFKTSINVLVKRAEELSLREVRGLKNVLKDLDGEAFVSLKRLRIFDCHEVQHVIDAVDPVAGSVFINLESLYMISLDNLTAICQGNLPMRSFESLRELRLMTLPAMRHLWSGPIQPPCLGNLAYLKMTNCNAIRRLFLQSVIKCLVKLQLLYISECEILEEIVSRETGEGKIDNEKIEFPKLDTLILKYLPEFRNFYPESKDMSGSKRNHDVGTVRTFFNQQVVLPSMEILNFNCLDNMVKIMDSQTQAESVYNLRSMNVSQCKKLLNVAASDQIMLLQNLNYLSVDTCDSLEEVFDFAGIKVIGEQTEVVLGQLEYMELKYLPKLTHIWRMVPEGIQGFQTLTSLIVENCDNLRCLLSPCMVNVLVNLQHITIKNCNIMEEIVTKQNGGANIDIIVFPMLHSLELEDLKSLSKFNSGEHGFEFPSLEELVITNCHNMTMFCSGPLSAPKLEGVMIEDEEQELASDPNTMILKKYMS